MTTRKLVETILLAMVLAAVTGLIVFAIALGTVSMRTANPRDDTDPPNGRSNLIPYRDARTGCHYLSSSRGGLFPRMEPNGRQLCD